MLAMHIPIRTRFPSLSVYLGALSIHHDYPERSQKKLTQWLIMFPIDIRLTFRSSAVKAIDR